MPTIISLNGSRWKCAASAMSTPDVTEIDRLSDVFPATVPGDVHLDVLAATQPGTDLFFGFNKAQGDWVEQRDWWYWTEFNVALEPGQRVWLVLHGADYISWTFLNGNQLGQHEGMFSEQIYEITPFLQAENRLAVRFLAPTRFPDHHITFYNKLLNRYEQWVGADAGCDPERRSTLKCQMSYGWDFAPGIRTLGLWDDVELWVTGAAAILSARVRTSLRDLDTSRPAATLDIEFEVDGVSATPIEFEISLHEAYPAPKPDRPVVVSQMAVPSLVGRQKLSLTVALEDPKLWYPWDHGAQNLYELEIVAAQAGQRVDRCTQTFGLRDIDLSSVVGEPFSRNGMLAINGQPVFLRGASWVPADAIPARVMEPDYQALLTLAKEAHLNCLRVWGGGLREKRAFYDLCDRLGLLVWQEFPLACAFYTHYPVSAEYQALLKDEGGAIVRTLRHHPAIFLWCGGNEFDARANAQVVDSLRQVVAEEDGTRLFMKVSPSTGESHNWNVWHQFFPPEAYGDDPARLLSEFGLQACPAVESMQRFLPMEALWPPGPAWTYHKGQIKKLRHYAQPFQSADTLEDFVRASQKSQAYGLKLAIEHVRRRKRDTAGFSVWQLNSPWPSIDWAVVDYYRTPKLAYEAIKTVANPTLICLEFPFRRYQPGETFGAGVWVINDTGTALPDCEAEIRLGGALLYSSRINVAPASSQKIGDVTVVLKAESLQVECRLTRQGAGLSENAYCLTDFDGRWIPRALMTKLQLRLHGAPG